jgi:hypothetical protein
MAILTRQDFERAIADSVSKYPTLAQLYQAQDPRILQPLYAMASMLSMFSNQVELSVMEVFKKTKNGTILADSAMRGIIRKGEPTRAKVKFFNQNDTPFIVDTDRLVSDATGKTWTVEAGKIIPADESVLIDCVQLITRREVHRVTKSEPFYAIPILKDIDDSLFIHSINIEEANGKELEYRDRYVNTLVGERIYHVETDERERIFIRFGIADIVGFQPDAGEEFTIITQWTHGASAMPQYESPFAFDSITTVNDSYVKITLETIERLGDDPMPMRVLRDLAHYPSTYDHNAVFLGEFDFLIRRHYPELAFISVWNEAIEERVRGYSVHHINKLFISVSDGSDVGSLFVEKTGNLTQFSYIPENTYTLMMKNIVDTIKRADSSYRVKFIRPVIRHIEVEIVASVAKVFSLDTVRESIRAEVLAEFGREGISYGKRFTAISIVAIHDLLRNSIQALMNDQADLRVSIVADPLQEKPEAWYMVSESSLSVTVAHVNALAYGWR